MGRRRFSSAAAVLAGLVVAAGIVPLPLAVAEVPATCDGKAATVVGTDTADRKLRGTRGSDVIAALGGDDRAYGLNGDDALCGGTGKDFLSGGAGNDALFGEAGDDRLGGDSGNDVIDGGPGADVVSGGPGDDIIYVNDNTRDVVTCGSGRDRVYADQFDRVARNCEHVLVNRAPSGVSIDNSSVPEGVAAGTTVGTLNAVDPDDGDTATFALVDGGADNALFSITGNTLRTGAVFDYEDRATYHVMVRATDTGGLSFTKTFTITIDDVDEAPPDTAPTAVGDTVTVSRYAGATTVLVAANDLNADGGPFTIESVTQPANGTVAIVGDSVTYQPTGSYCNSDQSGDGAADTFTYTLNGGSTATVSVTVVAPTDQDAALVLTLQRNSVTPQEVVPNQPNTNQIVNSAATNRISAAGSSDPGSCSDGSLVFDWVITYPQIQGPYRVAGITGHATPVLTVVRDSLININAPGITLTLTVTSTVTGLVKVQPIQAIVTGSSVGIAMYNLCQAQPNDPGCLYPTVRPPT